MPNKYRHYCHRCGEEFASRDDYDRHILDAAPFTCAPTPTRLLEMIGEARDDQEGCYGKR